MAPPRNRVTTSEGPSTTDASVNGDVEMQDQDKPINGFNKFSVSAPGCRQPRDALPFNATILSNLHSLKFLSFPADVSDYSIIKTLQTIQYASLPSDAMLSPGIHN